MIDIHSHILPGFDDGPSDIETTLKMARIAVKDGITAIVATPHCWDGVYNCRKQDIVLACHLLNKVLKKQKIPLTIYPGAENRLTPELLDLHQRDELLTLGDYGRTLLIELPQQFFPEYVVKVFRALRDRGIQVIVAHPERNMTIQGRPVFLDELIYAGALMQITAGSLTSRFNGAAKKLTLSMLEEGKVHFVATDSHNKNSRPPRLRKAVKKLSSLVGQNQSHQIITGSYRLTVNDSRMAQAVN